MLIHQVTAPGLAGILLTISYHIGANCTLDYLQGYGQYCFGCSGTPGEESRERCDSICDMFIHGLFCLHPFALAQEGRELRRRTLHPAFQPYLVVTMAPPMEQSMSS